MKSGRRSDIKKELWIQNSASSTSDRNRRRRNRICSSLRVWSESRKLSTMHEILHRRWYWCTGTILQSEGNGPNIFDEAIGSERYDSVQFGIHNAGDKPIKHDSQVAWNRSQYRSGGNNQDGAVEPDIIVPDCFIMSCKSSRLPSWKHFKMTWSWLIIMSDMIDSKELVRQVVFAGK